MDCVVLRNACVLYCLHTFNNTVKPLITGPGLSSRFLEVKNNWFPTARRLERIPLADVKVLLVDDKTLFTRLCRCLTVQENSSV